MTDPFPMKAWEGALEEAQRLLDLTHWDINIRRGEVPEGGAFSIRTEGSPQKAFGQRTAVLTIDPDAIPPEAWRTVPLRALVHLINQPYERGEELPFYGAHKRGGALGQLLVDLLGKELPNPTAPIEAWDDLVTAWGQWQAALGIDGKYHLHSGQNPNRYQCPRHGREAVMPTIDHTRLFAEWERRPDGSHDVWIDLELHHQAGESVQDTILHELIETAFFDTAPVWGAALRDTQVGHIVRTIFRLAGEPVPIATSD